MANPRDSQPQPQPMTAPAPARSQPTQVPRTVQFVVDRDHVVDAEVIREHQDGSLDLRGKFNQHTWTTTKEKALHPQSGQSAEFDVDVPADDETISTRLRVRKADEDQARLGRFTPGTWFVREADPR